jgi:hypothetical protein
VKTSEQRLGAELGSSKLRDRGELWGGSKTLGGARTMARQHQCGERPNGADNMLGSTDELTGRCREKERLQTRPRAWGDVA